MSTHCIIFDIVRLNQPICTIVDTCHCRLWSQLIVRCYSSSSNRRGAKKLRSMDHTLNRISLFFYFRKTLC